jgi:hypothetical protein
MNIKELFIQECLTILKRSDIKEELKQISKQYIDIILQDIYPYIIISFIFVIISFILMLSIFIILIHKYFFLNV